MDTERFHFGEWLVDPPTNSIEQAGERRQMEPRAMDVLVVLCQAAGRVVSADELLTQCWRTHVYGDNPVHKTLTQLRRLLGDAASSPVYIETLRKRGYRTVAPVRYERSVAVAASHWGTGSPFRGLHPFEEDHAQVFFGRDEPIRRLVGAVTTQVEGGLALQLVLGPSGSGKTSLVRAGLFPALAPERRHGRPALLSATTFDLAEQGDQTFFTALASAMLDLQAGNAVVFSGESALSLGKRVEHEREQVIRRMTAFLATHAGEGDRLLFGIFIDRFEGLFAPGRTTDAERQAFFELLEDLARSQAVLVVIGCRNDFYPHIARHPLLMAGKPDGAHFDLAPPGFADIAQIIRQPAVVAGLRFGQDPHSHARLDDILCESAAASPDALPLLQYCLQELYRLRTADGELSFEAFHKVGGVEGAIEQRAEQVVAQLDDAQKAALARVMSLVVVIAANEETVISCRAPWSVLRDDAERQVVDALVESRLFVSELSGDVPGFGIAHEAILRRWPRMREWIDTHRSALLERARLANLAARWVREGRSHDLLLPAGKQLEAARAVQASPVFTLTGDETQLIRLSTRRARSRERLRLMAMLTIVVLAVLATVLGISATAARHLAEKKRVEAEGLMGFMLGDFADRLRPLGRLDLLDGVSAKAMEYLGASPGNEASVVALTQRAQALQVIGEVRRARGDSKGAAEALGAAQEILMQQQAAAPSDTGVLRNLGVNAYWLGQVAKDQNELEKAAGSWERYRKYSEELHRLEPENVEWWIEQSYAHNNLGSLAVLRGDAATAVREFQASIALKRKAFARKPDSQSLAEELADSYSWLGSAREALGELDTAGELFAQEMAIIQRLRLAAPGAALWTRGEARALQHRAANRLAHGLDELALEDYRAARAQLSAITGQDRKNLTWQADVADLELEEQAILARSRTAPGQVARMKDIHGRLAALLQHDPKNVVWARRAGMARARLALALLGQGQPDAARQEARAAVSQLDALHSGNPANKSLQLAAIHALLIASQIDEAAKDGASARAACGNAAGMMAADAASSLDFRILDPWVRVNYCLGKDAVAEEAARRLHRLGYRDIAYLRYLSFKQRKGES
jgi:DNA-binding winged helix-turn-helix (wHTH) protein/tetratricopeptide (TPR) repeat protein